MYKPCVGEANRCGGGSVQTLPNENVPYRMVKLNLISTLTRGVPVLCEGSPDPKTNEMLGASSRRPDTRCRGAQHVGY